MDLSFDFTGRVLLLTGATGGIGRATAELFASAGADLVLADIEVGALERTAKGLLGRGSRKIVTHEYDASSEGSAEALVAHAREEVGRIDFVVPAAGVFPTSLVSEASRDEVRRVLQINLECLFSLAAACEPHMAEGGSLTALSSIAGLRGSHGHSHYAAAKAGVVAFVRSLAKEWGPSLRANAVSPGTIDTPMAREEIELRGARLIEDTPLHRFGRPEEVAAVIAFLSSDAAGFVNGENIHINGGLYMGA